MQRDNPIVKKVRNPNLENCKKKPPRTVLVKIRMSRELMSLGTNVLGNKWGTNVLGELISKELMSSGTMSLGTNVLWGTNFKGNLFPRFVNFFQGRLVFKEKYFLRGEHFSEILIV